MNNILDAAIECIPLTDLQSLQLKRLQKVLDHAKINSPLYKKKLKNIDLRLITSLHDITHIPFTTKDELVAGGSHCTLAVPLDEVAEVHFSSGTTKSPVASFLSKKDIEASNHALSRTWYMQGIRKSSIFGMLASYGLFSAGLINHYAIQNLGAFVVPIGGVSTDKIIQLLLDFKIDSLAAVASHYFHILRRIKLAEIDVSQLKLRTIIAGGEPFTESHRAFIEHNLNVKMFDQYGLCEINTGIAGECVAQDGLHLLADYAYPEIIDPVTEKVLAEGETGELVLTTLAKEASPLIRYRTGDITSITYEPCRCGRTLPRISRIKERVSKTIFHKGLKLERSFISDVLIHGHEYIDPYLWKFIFNSEELDSKIEIKVSPRKPHSPEVVEVFLRELVMKKLGFHAQITFFEPVEIVTLEGHKLHHFVDRKARI
jgi:phenylacetate-CoA ligase